MARETVIITVDPESELGRALEKLDDAPIILVCNGIRFNVTRDPWANYDPEKVREGLRRVAGLLTEEEADRIKEGIYRGREEGTRPIDRPQDTMAWRHCCGNRFSLGVAHVEHRGTKTLSLRRAGLLFADWQVPNRSRPGLSRAVP